MGRCMGRCMGKVHGWHAYPRVGAWGNVWVEKWVGAWVDARVGYMGVGYIPQGVLQASQGAGYPFPQDPSAPSHAPCQC